MIIPLRYIYCYWLWIWAILYYFNITKISPFITLIISTTFTIYNVLIGPRGKVAPLSLRIAISIIELFFLILIGYKSNKISIKDIIVLESLASDGVLLPKDLDYSQLSSELTVPQSLDDLVNQNQVGLVMLKLIEIIGEDNISDLDPETIYFLNRILNQLNLKKIRNNILSVALPVRV